MKGIDSVVVCRDSLSEKKKDIVVIFEAHTSLLYINYYELLLIIINYIYI